MISLRRRAAAAAVAVLLAGGLATTPATPAGAAPPRDRCYVAALHEVFLGRPASTYDIELWTTLARDQSSVAGTMARSDAWLEAVVVGIYDAALDRAPDPEGLVFWIGRLKARARVATVYAQVYGSDEVWQRAGATAPGFVADVFPRIMGRAPTAGDVDYWAGEVPRRGRGGVAKALLGSFENRSDRVADLYQEVLGRAAEPGGQAYWARRLATIDDVDLAVLLARSDEAWDQAQVGCTAGPAPTRSYLTLDIDRSALSADVSDDGRWVAFVSSAVHLVPGGTDNGYNDLFLLDRQTREIVRVAEGDDHISGMSISDDGRHIVFTTAASDLLPGADPVQLDVFSWDRTTGTLTRVTDGNRESAEPTISADGRYIAFSSRATNLVAGDPSTVEDVFVWDRTTATTQRLTDGTESSYAAVVAPDGSRVAFSSIADDIAPGGTLDSADVFIWERAGGTTSWIAPGTPMSMAADGDLVYGETIAHLRLHDAQTGEATTIVHGDHLSAEARIATDGQSVAFTSWARLLPGDPKDTPEVYVWERATGTVIRVSPADATSAQPTTTADGRYVIFHWAPRDPKGQVAELLLWDRGA